MIHCERHWPRCNEGLEDFIAARISPSNKLQSPGSYNVHKCIAYGLQFGSSNWPWSSTVISSHRRSSTARLRWWLCFGCNHSCAASLDHRFNEPHRWCHPCSWSMTIEPLRKGRIGLWPIIRRFYSMNSFISISNPNPCVPSQKFNPRMWQLRNLPERN